MNEHKVKPKAALAAVYVGFLGTLFACTGDDTTGSGAAGASSGTAGASSGTAGASSGTAGASSGTAGASSGTAGASSGTAGASSGTAGAPSGGENIDAGSDASIDSSTPSDATMGLSSDSATDALVEVAVDSSVGADANDAGATPSPLAMCPLFDTDFQLSIADASANQAAYQRTQWWDYAINANFINDVSNDCRINGIGAIVDPFGWASSLSPWTLQFLGCPAPGDAGALSYTGIIPAELMGHTFTNADLDVFSALYIQAIAETLTCGGPCPPNDGTLGPANDQPNFTNLPALTADQASVINAQIAYLQSMYGATNFNAYTESTCIDAGPDAAPDAPADSEGNAPADASDGG